LLQKNVLDLQRWATREELRLAIITWIESTYHRRRRQRSLGKLTPIEFEMQHSTGRSRGLNSIPRGTSASQLKSGQTQASAELVQQSRAHARI